MLERQLHVVGIFGTQVRIAAFIEIAAVILHEVAQVVVSWSGGLHGVRQLP